GQANFDILSSCETYHIEENEWRDFVSLPISLLGAQAAVLDDKLWVLGGTTQAKKCKEGSLLVYDEKRGNWCFKTPMITDRVHFGAASAYGCLFVFGGIGISKENDGMVLDSCEKYNVESNKWITIAPLGKGRAYHGVAVVNDLIYVIGGYNGSKWLDSVECYDPLSDRWTTVSPMMGCRSSFGVSVWNKRIYCMGGFNGQSTLSTVMKYNPKTDMWHGVHNMHLKRYGLMVATVAYRYEKISRLKDG
ncbi:Kelch-like protein 20, partial [Armadillidium nasatum]